MNHYWTIYTQNHARPTKTLLQSMANWTPIQIAWYNHITDRRWETREAEIVLVSLGPGHRGRHGPPFAPWANDVPRPVMAVGANRAVMISSSDVNVFSILPVRGGTNVTVSDRVRLEGISRLEVASGPPEPGAWDVTRAVFAEDGNLNQTLCLGTSNGRVLRAKVGHGSGKGIKIQESARYDQPEEAENVTGLATEGDTLAAISNLSGSTRTLATGIVSLFSIRAPWKPPERLLLPGRLECVQLALDASTPFVAIGARRQPPSNSSSWARLSGARIPKTERFRPSSPLAVHPITSSGLSPSAISHLSPQTHKESVTNAPYALCRPSPCSPFGSSPNIVVSGWFDGSVNVHDLRLKKATPTLSFLDRWVDDRVYSVGMGGGQGAYVMAGMGTNASLQVYDARRGGRGFGVYCPCSDVVDHKTVYSLHVEGSRVWGVTDRFFMFDFGPGGRATEFKRRVVEYQ